MEKKSNFERAEIQEPLHKAVEDKLKEIGCEPTPEHVRRTIRSILRIGAKIALENGCPPRAFMEMAQEAFTKEAGAESLMVAAFVAKAKSPSGAKA
jgi:hypothetical protein